MKSIYKVLDEIATRNGYDDKNSLLMDYGIFPTVKVPSHKKIEFISLILRNYKKKKK